MPHVNFRGLIALNVAVIDRFDQSVGRLINSVFFVFFKFSLSIYRSVEWTVDRSILFFFFFVFLFFRYESIVSGRVFPTRSFLGALFSAVSAALAT